MKKLVSIFLCIIMLITSISIVPVSAEETSLVKEVAMITSHHMEVRFNEDVSNVNSTSDFKIFVNGTELSQSKYSFWCYFDNMATIYFNDAQNEPLDKIIEVQITDSSIKGTSSSTPIDTTKKYTAIYDPHYKKKLVTKSGIIVKAPESVSDDSIIAAGRQVDILLSKIPEVAAEMASHNASLAIIGPGEHCYAIPEHRQGYDIANYWVEGYGGTPWNDYTSSITESNINRWLDSNLYPDTTSYVDENILAHEFGHGIKICGIDLMDDTTLSDLIIDTYESVRSKGLWDNTYAAENIDEYYATMTNIWLGTQSESATFDGTWSPINTRAELKIYDPETYALMEQIYNKTSMPEPWNLKHNYYDYSQGTTDPDTFDSFTVEYNTAIWKYSAESEKYAIINSNSQRLAGIASVTDNSNYPITQNGTYEINNVPNNLSWKLEYALDGYYRIINVSSSLCMDVMYNSTQSGGYIVQNPMDSTDDAQLWKLTPVSDGLYKIENKLSGLALDVVSTTTLNGMRLVQRAYTGAKTQQWEIKSTETAENFIALDFSALISAINNGKTYDADLYMSETYKVLADAIDFGERVMQSTDITQEIINNACNNILDAINGLIKIQNPVERPDKVGKNIAVNADIQVSYVTGWNNTNAINDNSPSDPYSTYTQVTEDKAWGTWPEAGPHTVTLTWDNKVTIDSMDILWHFDQESGVDGGVQVPKNAYLYYLNEDGNMVPVPNCSLIGNKGTKNENIFNYAAFDTITTTQLQLVIYPNKNADAVGIVEWMVYEAQQAESVDKTALENALDSGNEYYNNTDYTQGSLNNLKSALDNGQDVLENDNASQEDVDNAIDLINDAIDNLVLRPKVEADKDTYLINELITLTVTTPEGITDIGVTNEYGKNITMLSESVIQNSDGTSTWTVVISLGTKGDRTINILTYSDEQLIESNLNASFKVIVENITEETGSIISINPDVVGADKNELVNVQVVTTASVRRLELFNEYGNLISSIKSYEETNNQKIWNVTFCMGSKGERTLTVKISDNLDAGWSDNTSSFKAYIGVPIPSESIATEIYSVNTLEQVYQKNEIITATVETSQSATYLRIINEYDNIISCNTSYTDSGDIRIWTVNFAVASKGTRTLTFQGGNGIDWTSEKDLLITID